MRKIKKGAYLLVALGVVAICACTVAIKREQQNSPDAAQTYFEEYLEVCKSGYKNAAEYVYFDNDWEMEFFVGNVGEKLLDYTILGSESINDSLTAFQVELETASDRTLGRKPTIYNFVAKIDGEYKVITNIRNVPDSLREGIDEDKYTSPDSNDEVSFEEIL